MLHYGGKSPKRHVGFSNSSFVGRLWLGRLTGWKRDPELHVHTYRRYKDSSGKQRYTGTKDLRKSEMPKLSYLYLFLFPVLCFNALRRVLLNQLDAKAIEGTIL